MSGDPENLNLGYPHAIDSSDRPSCRLPKEALSSSGHAHPLNKRHQNGYMFFGTGSSNELGLSLQRDTGNKSQGVTGSQAALGSSDQVANI